jgi:hypothetical protein
MNESDPKTVIYLSKETTGTEVIEKPEPTDEEQWYLYGI